GAEGIAGSLPWNGSIAERPEDLASAAFELYANRDKWQEAQRRGTDIINNRFAKGLFVSDFWQRMQTLQGSLSEHRKHNFIGQCFGITIIKALNIWLNGSKKKMAVEA